MAHLWSIYQTWWLSVALLVYQRVTRSSITTKNTPPRLPDQRFKPQNSASTWAIQDQLLWWWFMGSHWFIVCNCRIMIYHDYHLWIVPYCKFVNHDSCASGSSFLALEHPTPCAEREVSILLAVLSALCAARLWILGRKKTHSTISWCNPRSLDCLNPIQINVFDLKTPLVLVTFHFLNMHQVCSWTSHVFGYSPTPSFC